MMIKTGNKIKCLSAGKEINTQWCVHTKEYYLATKKDELLILTIPMNLRIIMLSERSQILKEYISMIPFI